MCGEQLPMFQRGRPVLVAVLSIALIAVLAGCGGGDDPSPTAGTSSGSATTEAPSESTVDLAPEFASMDGWHNTAPLTLAALRGSPVLLVFWSDT
jgi:hypothetical protein